MKNRKGSESVRGSIFYPVIRWSKNQNIKLFERRIATVLELNPDRRSKPLITSFDQDLKFYENNQIGAMY